MSTSTVQNTEIQQLNLKTQKLSNRRSYSDSLLALSLINSLNTSLQATTQEDKTSPSLPLLSPAAIGYTNFSSNNQQEKDLAYRLNQAMSEMSTILGDLETEYTELEESQEQGQIQMGTWLTNLVQAETEKKLKNVSDQLNKETHESVWQKVAKAFEIIATIVISVAAIAAGNPEIAVMAITFLVLSLTGATKDLTSAIAKGITKSLEKDGMSSEAAKKLANVIAGVLVTALTIVATLGAGAAAGAVSGASIAVDDLTSATENIADTSADLENTADESLSSVDSDGDGTESTETSDSESDTAQNTHKTASQRALQGIRSVKKLTVMAGVQSTLSTNLLPDIVSAAMVNSKNSKLKMALEIIAEIIAIIGAIAATAGAGMMGDVLEDSEGLLNNLSSKVKSMTQSLTNLSESQLKFASMGTQSISQSLSSIPSFANGVLDIQIGNLKGELGEINGTLYKLRNEFGESEDLLKQSQSQAHTTLTSYQQLTSDIGSYVQALATATQVLAIGL
jgi:predicted PurR-regulated permease PerM